MKKALFLAFIFISILITFSDSWETKAAMPTPRNGSAGAVIGSKIYIAGGSDTSANPIKILEVYDTNSNTWETKTAMNTSKTGAKGTSYNGKMYVFGGYDGSQTVNYTEMYDPSDNSWYGKANMPTARYDMIAEEVNGIIYVIGGYIYPENTKTDVNEAYNPETNTWEAKTVLPDEIRGMGSAVYNGKIYVFGGAAWNFEDSLYVYDTFLDTWEKKASMQTVRSYLTGTELFGKIYAIGGYFPPSSSSLDTIEIYNPITDTWKPGLSMITARHFLCSNTVDNHIFVIGGYSSASSSFTDVNEMYTPDAVEISSTVIDDSLCSNNGQIESGETISLGINLQNIINTNVYLISATLSSPDANIQILANQSNYPDLSEGEISVNLEDFSFHIPSNHFIENAIFNLDILTDKRNSFETFTLPVHLPVDCDWTYAVSVPQSIPDNSPAGINNIISISNNMPIKNLNCFVDISHTYKGDLIVELTSPLGTKVRLHDRTGDSANNIYTIYDSTTIPDGPGTMNDFNDGNPVGDWTLWISDNAGSDVGTLNNWGLEICNIKDEIYPEINFPCPNMVAINNTMLLIVKDELENEIALYNTTSFLISSDSAGDYHFYSDYTGNNEIYKVILSASESRKNFYYYDTISDTVNLTLKYEYGEYFSDVTNSTYMQYPGEITYYEITAFSPQTAGAGWTETVTAKDTDGNTVYTDSSTEINIFSTGNAKFYSDGTYSILQNTTVLNSGIATLYIKDTKAETIQISVSDTNAKTGNSGDIIVLPERIVFIDPPSEVYANTLNKFSIGLSDQFDRATVFKGVGLTISLNSTGNGVFKDDNGEINSVYIAEGENTADFYYINKICEIDTITASNLFLTSAEHTLKVKSSKNLDNVVVYPNPAKDDFINFENITNDAIIYIYTITGELVYKYENANGQNNFKWYLLNSNDNKVASGVYFYVITNNQGEKKIGKIAIVK